MSILFYPIVTFLLLAVCISYWAVTAVFLASSGEAIYKVMPTQPNCMYANLTCDPEASHSLLPAPWHETLPLGRPLISVASPDRRPECKQCRWVAAEGDGTFPTSVGFAMETPGMPCLSHSVISEETYSCVSLSDRQLRLGSDHLLFVAEHVANGSGASRSFPSGLHLCRLAVTGGDSTCMHFSRTPHCLPYFSNK
ncbi:hypothetical protein AAFF_G00306060 [Aldrovandia affinis]|uniref:Uncharacterized protein n=1 Tax=Aldrovandia affinis TaxID=143900 RepID=A0AAD7SPR6_9TELE|nr:hypothetical protein AAFF_G00306060 [Aldrovandia affinis]